MSRVRRPRVASLTFMVTLAAVLALAGCSGSSESSPRPTAAASTATETATGLSDLDTLALVVPRAPFCDRVDPAAVTRALGREPADTASYRSGQRVRVSEDVADVVHEFGCRWTAGGSAAEAWVFAPPVTVARARRLAAEVRGSRGCRTRTAPDFGRPSAVCASRSDELASMSYYGLFGDAWLSCSLSLADESVTTVADRASVWCADLATGAAGS